MPLTLALQAMATRFELVMAGGTDRELRAAGEQALEEIARVERLISPFRNDSQIAHLNRHGASWVVLDPEVIELLGLCSELRDATDGRFDPTLGRGDLEVDGPRARLSGTGTRLDLGAIGKGWAIDLAVETLREAGVSCALLHGGTSTAAAIGVPPDRPAWQVAVRSDSVGGAPVVSLTDGHALSVSAPTDRRHVIDPATGLPIDERDLAVVVTTSAAHADAWSTALLVGGDPPPHLASLVVAGPRSMGHDPDGVIVSE